MPRQASPYGSPVSKDGKWTTRIVAAHDGKRYHVTADSRAELEAKCRAIHDGRTDDRQPPTPTLRQMFDRKRDEEDSLALAPRTERGYKYVAKYVPDSLWEMGVGSITPADVQRAITSIRLDDGSMPKENTRRAAWRIISRTLTFAVQQGVIASNPASVFPNPKVKPQADVGNHHTLSPEQFTKWWGKLVANHASSDVMLPLVGTYLLLGLRRSEALALRWSDFSNLDGDKPRLHVERSIVENDVNALSFGPLKNANSDRKLSVPSVLAGVLLAHCQETAGQRARVGERWGKGWPDDLVFTSRVGTPLYPGRVTTWVGDSSYVYLGERFTPQDLRHTFATKLIDRGASLKVVSYALGHADVATTGNMYVDTTDEQRAIVADIADGWTLD